MITIASTRGHHHWLAAGKIGFGQFGWCTASYPFNLGGIYDQYPSRTTSEYIMLTVRLGSSTANIETHMARERLVDTARALCKP
jgi:hypothetical protein